MTEAVDGSPAYLLHQRPWRETSLLLDVLTPAHGRVALVARGRRRGRRGQASLNLFQPLVLSWRGRGDLRSLTAAEPASSRWLVGQAALLGLYANEVLTRVLHRDDPHPALYSAYTLLLDRLAEGPDEAADVALRRFELALLDDIGYGLDLQMEWDSGLPVSAAASYRYEPGAGLVLDPDGGLQGAHVLAMAADEFSDPAVRRAAKRLLRRALAPYLGAKPLHSRRLFQQRVPVPELPPAGH